MPRRCQKQGKLRNRITRHDIYGSKTQGDHADVEASTNYHQLVQQAQVYRQHGVLLCFRRGLARAICTPFGKQGPCNSQQRAKYSREGVVRRLANVSGDDSKSQDQQDEKSRQDGLYREDPPGLVLQTSVFHA